MEMSQKAGKLGPEWRGEPQSHLHVHPCSTDPHGLQDDPPKAHLHLKASSAWTPVVFSVSSGGSSPLCGEGQEEEDALSSDRLVKDQVRWRGSQSHPHTAFSPSQGTQPIPQAGGPPSTSLPSLLSSISQVSTQDMALLIFSSFAPTIAFIPPSPPLPQEWWRCPLSLTAPARAPVATKYSHGD